MVTHVLPSLKPNYAYMDSSRKLGFLAIYTGEVMVMSTDVGDENC